MQSHSHHHNDTKDIANLRLAFFINLAFTIIEIIGGLFTNSLAILSDALHDLGDSLSLAMAWYFQHISKREKTEKFTYGYRRFALLGAIINSIVLLVGSIIIIYHSIPRLLNPEEANAGGMIGLAILGIVVNGVAALRLKKGSSQNEKVVSLHLLEDVLGWIAVLIGSVVIYYTSWYYIDPILSLLISCYVLFNVYKNIRKTLEIILQAIPDNITMKNVRALLLTIEGVEGIHNLHIWSLDGERNILTVHLVLNEFGINRQAEIKQAIKALMREEGIHHCTLEIESELEDCEQSIE